ncbi:hypothetical protein CALCODRAFT_511305 [Calocera cornea HHB12733]|uniref:Uncharacterized protein n=1 Tax=Calocera cornea HHB12733 TaxID=1353952 RepID=A0A165DUW0_9BASI|nr:hypothetical protein CALCODRAFT_511305 [Calocera cornea HHB12733]
MSTPEPSVATARVSWDSSAPRDYKSPPRKYQRAASNEDINADGGSSPLGEDSTIGTQSSAKADTSDTAVDDEVMGAEDDAVGGGPYSAPHNKHPHSGWDVGTVAPHTYIYLNSQLHTSESLAMVVMVGTSCVVLTSNAIARFYGFDHDTDRWKEMGSYPTLANVMVRDTLPAAVSFQEDEATITLAFYADQALVAERELLTVIRVVRHGPSITFTPICVPSEVLLASEGQWAVSHQVRDLHLSVRRLSDDKCVVLEGCCPQPRVGRIAAAIMDDTVWVVNYDFACVEGYKLLEIGERAVFDTTKTARLPPLFRVDMEEPVIEARFDVFAGDKYLILRYEFWITVYKIEDVTDGIDNPLVPVWIFDFSSPNGEETPHMSDFTLVLQSKLMFFLDQSRDANRPSSLKAIRVTLSSNASSPVCVTQDHAWVVADGGHQELLQHVDHLRYEERSQALIVGRKNSCLWLTMPLEPVPGPGLAVTVNADYGLSQLPTVRMMKDNTNWQREWQLKTSRLRTGPSEMGHRSLSFEGLQLHHLNVVTGEGLIGYWTDWVGQPWGDAWVLQYGLRLDVPVELLAVCITSYMNCAVIEATFPNGCRFFRLDRYHEEDELRHSIAISSWNQESWQACLSKSSPGDPDGSSLVLDFDALLAEEAAELERQKIARALQMAEEESTPSAELLAAWLRMGFDTPGDYNHGEGQEAQDQDLNLVT